jgi:hypothetical protein
MNIDIKTIPHKEQRYPTVGDWYYTKEGVLIIRISCLDDWRMEACVAIHEFVECVLCHYMGVTQQMVDEFDTKFENNRPYGNTDEPGDNPRAPYRIQHCIATGVERIVASFLGFSWKKYDDKVNSL